VTGRRADERTAKLLYWSYHRSVAENLVHIRAALRFGACPDAVHAGTTALASVVNRAANEENGRAALEVLLSAGANPEYVLRGSRAFVICCACEYQDLAMLAALLAAGASPNVQNQYNDSPLRIAARRRWLPGVRLLLRCGALIKCEDQPSPLLAALQRDANSCPEETHAVVRVLLDAGADPTDRQPSGHTTLEWAARHATAWLPMLRGESN